MIEAVGCEGHSIIQYHLILDFFCILHHILPYLFSKDVIK